MHNTSAGRGDGKNGFRQKLKALWADKRTYPQRLLAAAAAAFAWCFTFIYFGPVEIAAFSEASLSFGVMQLTPLMICTALAVFAAAALALSGLRGKIFNYAVSAVFAMTVCGYIQGNFLNGDLGTLTGDAIDWNRQTGAMLLNLLVWTVLFLIPYIIQYFNKKVWYNVVVYGSALLVIMQAAALFSVYAGRSAVKPDEDDYYLSQTDLTRYSKENNTLVFLLDRLDYDFIQEVLDEDPTFFDELDGFTSYQNAISEHARTKPAANFILTACENGAWEMPEGDYFDASWTAGGHNLLQELKQASYTVDLYTELGNLFGDGQAATAFVDNATNAKAKLNYGNVIGNMLTLSAYRYMPTSMKPFFWCYTDTVNSGAYSKGSIYEIDETQYARKIGSLQTGSGNYFKFYHFNGSHSPYTLSADGTRKGGSTSSLEQTKGCFQILFNAFAELKKLGIYEDATIIITADHGNPVEDNLPLMKATRIGLFYKPAGSAGTPLKTSQAPVSLKNIPATIAKSAGLDHAAYGAALDVVEENALVTRYFYKAVTKNAHSGETALYIYEVIGDAANFDNWTLVDRKEIRYPFY